MTRSQRREDLSVRDFHRILVIKPSSLGDIIHALPVVHSLRSRYPTAIIDWLVGSAFAPILEGNADINEAILFDRKKFSRLGVGLSATTDFVRMLKDLRRRNYDLVIDLQGLFRSGFLARSTGAPVRIGFADAREGAPLFYTHRISAVGQDVHAVDRNMCVSRLLDLATDQVRFALPLTRQVRERADSLLQDAGIEVEDKVIAIAPGARWETKIWSLQNFAATISALAQDQPDLKFVLLGGKEDEELCDRIAAASNGKAASLAGKTTLKEMVAVLDRVDLLLCHDSAPMHIAVALDRPLICLTGPTNPHRTGPYRRVNEVLRVPMPCSPCYLRKLSQCPHDHRCMRDLKVEVVVERARKLQGLGVRG